ncbi:integrase, catalytic region, zinc finger, CCHC-type containing protein, partial [Tanacetum coccineum]
MASDHVSSDPAPHCRTMALKQGKLSLNHQSQENVPQEAETVTTSINELDILFSPMFDEYFNGDNAMTDEDEFINVFSTMVHEVGDPSSRHVDSSNMHTFYQIHPSEHLWTIEHPLEKVIGNPSQSVRTRQQLETNGEMCMFALTTIMQNVIKMKWLWKNKCDEENIVIHKNTRLVAKGYGQKEGIDFEESFAPVARPTSSGQSLPSQDGISSKLQER